ncbi:unnamed protein product [Hymenolepis diminuta]|uniref:DNA 3'-5' helicase n=1 Tax=Hymenolepis diminuta TaxID=6216 RepID=A0A158QDS6_HYMDI|nr:unnamed protein product [Hymenolepis diminuta]
MSDWQSKFETKGISCLELTSDSPFYEIEDLSKHAVLIATPEKIDSLQRSLNGMQEFVSRISLLMVDEIHTIAEQPRGACLEGILTRLIVYNPRIIAVTATCSNISDIAQWLSKSERECLCRSFGSQFRPVPINKIVLGYRKSPQSSLFQFDQFLTKKVLPIIRTHSLGRPTLIFSITRKTAENTAESLARGAMCSNNVPQELIGRISNDLLRNCLSRGVGFHHAGVNPVDRRLIEETFVEVSTSTLSMGINLPAHLVIIKNTSLYVDGTTQEYTSRQMLQMIGRAGRPQFDTSATAVIMTTADKKEHYEHWLEDSENVESSLHVCLTDLLNVEIALDRVRSFDDILQWISCSYLAIRLPKNPNFYGFQRHEIAVTDFWKELCRNALDKLVSVGSAVISDADQSIGSTIIGQIMCEHFLSAMTVESFLRLTGSETLEDLIYYIAGCVEMNEISIRSQEKSALNIINKGTGVKKLRFPVRGRITTPQLKIVTLLQAELNDFVVLDSGLQQECLKTFRAFIRCAAGKLIFSNSEVRLRNLLWTTKSSGREVSNIATKSLPQSAAMSGFASMAHVIELAKIVANRVWADAPLASLRQLPDIGKDYAGQLAGAGVTSLKDIERVGPRCIEKILRRQPPFGDRVYRSALEVPKYELAAEQLATNAIDKVEFEFAIRLTRSCKFDQVALMVADDRNCIIFKTVLSTTMLESSGGWSQRVVVHYDPDVHYLFTSLISFNFLGIDLNINFPIPWPESTNDLVGQGLPATPTIDGSIDVPLPVTVSPYFSSAHTLAKIKVRRKQKVLRTATRTKPPKTSPKAEAATSTPKVTNDGLRQTNIMNFFKATKSFLEQAPEGKPMNILPALSPIKKLGILPCTSIFNTSKIHTPECHSSLLTPFTPDSPSIQPSRLIKSTPEIQPSLKKIKWDDNDDEEEISPETDKMVEEELCSFLSTVEATEAKGHSVNVPSFRVENTFSPILPVDLDTTNDNPKSLELEGLSTPPIISTQEVDERDELNFIPSFCVDRTISPIIPSDMNQSLKEDASSTPKVSKQSPFVHTPTKQSLIEFKTPKDMQLFTSLDDPNDSSPPPPNEKINDQVFKVPISATPLRRPQRQPLATFTQTPSTTTSAKLSKKVSFSIMLPKLDSDCGDTGYGSSPVSKETKGTDVSVKKKIEKASLTIAESVVKGRPESEEGKEREDRKGFLKTPSSSEVDFELLREGWDQLATFIYCYNILRNLAPRTPSHNPNDCECPRDACASSTEDTNYAVECPSASIQSPYPPQMKATAIDSKKTPQVEE